jgi:nitric oxide reductase NorD protein
VLQTAVRCAAALAGTLQAAGVACAIAGFSSRGRHAVTLQTIKAFGAPVDAATLGRLQALRPDGSTRLGSALRHAAACLVQRGAAPNWVVLLSDGEAHDVDVHDPRYLIEDARHAVRAAARRGVRIACLAVAPGPLGEARRIFGRGGVQPLHDLGDLPRVWRRLLS